MAAYKGLSREELLELRESLEKKFEEEKAKGLLTFLLTVTIIKTTIKRLFNS